MNNYVNTSTSFKLTYTDDISQISTLSTNRTNVCERKCKAIQQAELYAGFHLIILS